MLEKRSNNKRNVPESIISSPSVAIALKT